VNAGKVAGMLLPRGAVLSRRRGRRVGGAFTRWSVYRNPDDPIYGGRLTVLMDELCASATEMVLGALKAAGRAKLRGRRSARSTGNPRQFVSPGGVRFTCSSWEETTPEGEPIERHGVTTKAWRRRGVAEVDRRHG
jgi:C-terminal processing protease CtpA/Prc